MGEVEKGFGQITGHIFAIDEPNRLGLIATYAYLCFRADSETRECYPSQTTIGNAIGVKRETVNRYIKRLEELGLITKVAQSRKDGSGQTSSKYKIAAVIPQSQGCDSTVTGGVTEQSQGGVTERSHEHNHKEHNQKNNIYDDVVEDKDIEQESLSATTTAIINKLNSICNSNYKSTEVVMRYIQKLFDAGYTEQDMKLVLDIKAKEFVEKGKLAMTKPKNLFGDANRFDELLQEANNIHLKGSNRSYKSVEKEKKAISPEWEEKPKKEIQEPTEEEKQKLLQQLEEVRQKGKKKSG